MSENQETDFGPLTELVGVWKGDKGLDLSPDPEELEHNPYYETIAFSTVGNVTNAESQRLAVIHYRQIVQRKSNDEIFHDETGYWMWDARTGIIMQSLTIPRGVSVLAGGKYKADKRGGNSIVFEVFAGVNDQDWQIIQSPFMRSNARTTEFCHHISIGNDVLSYSETTTVKIYGKVFEHTDQNELIRQ